MTDEYSRPETCTKNSGKELESRTASLANGDEISLLVCEPCGRYMVKSMSDGIAVPEDHDESSCTEPLSSYVHHFPNGDTVEFDACEACGFYAADIPM